MDYRCRSLLFIMSVFCCCGQFQIVPSVTPAGCVEACQRLRELGCPEAAPTPRGAPCVAVCEAAGALLDPQCVAEARNVPEVRTCHVRCM